MLFKPYHIDKIKKRQKTETRRIWKRMMAKVGGTYACQVDYQKKRSECPLILVLYMRQEHLGEITEDGAKKEGYGSLEEFKEAWIKISGEWTPDIVVTVIGFQYLEDRQPGLDEWLSRELPDEFWKTAGKLPQDLAIKRLKEVPDFLRPLSSMIWMLASKTVGISCRQFRQLLFIAVQKLEKGSVPLYLPSYWFMDGVMIEPEWIVRLSNGIVGWSCDKPDAEHCGLEGCRFRENK